MSFIRKVVSSHSTEEGFITAFISALTSADERITCLTEDLPEQFENNDNVPEFVISIAGSCLLTFTRVGRLSERCFAYDVADQNGNASGRLYFTNNTLPKSQLAKRCFKYALTANEGVVNLSLYSLNSLLSSPVFSCTVITSENVICCGAVSNALSAIGGELVSQDSELFIKKDRLPYAYDTQEVTTAELIRNKVFTDPESDIRCFVTESLFDISTVTPNTVMTIGAKRYYSLDSHTIMEV